MDNLLSYVDPLLDGAWVTVQLTFYSTILGGVVALWRALANCQ